MHQERYISEKVAAMWNYPHGVPAVAGIRPESIWMLFIPIQGGSA